MKGYTTREFQAVMIARQIGDGQIVVAGTGLPLVGCTLAKKTHAPGCKILVESGLMDARATEVPTSVGDLRFMASASVLWPQVRYLGLQANVKRKGLNVIAFIGGAEIDPYGNLNSTAVGDYHHPKVRLSGSGGANGIATYFPTIITMKHEKRRFVEKIDYVTSPGWVDGPMGRHNKGLSSEVGPRIVVTDLCLMSFDEKTKRLKVSLLYPGVSPQQVQDNTGFDIDVSEAKTAKEPEEAVLRVLRQEVDPYKNYI